MKFRVKILEKKSYEDDIIKAFGNLKQRFLYLTIKNIINLKKHKWGTWMENK